MKTNRTNQDHREFNDAMKQVLARFKDILTGEEMLAVASHLVGVLIAVQDQKKYTLAQIMELVSRNIETGNAEAIAGLTNTKGNA